MKLLIYILLKISKLSIKNLYLLADFFYFLGYKIFAYRKKVVRQNLINSFPHKSKFEIVEIEKKFYRNLSEIVVETIKCFTITEKEVRDMIYFEHDEEVTKILKTKQNFIFTAGHSGNWELANLGASIYLPVEVRAIYQPLNNAIFEDFFLNWRSRFGTQLFPKKKGIIDQLFIANKKAFCVALINDQSPKPSIAHWSTFLNQETGFYKGPAENTLKYNLPLVFMHIRRIEKGKYKVVSSLIKNTGTVESILEEYKFNLENEILQDPANWLWSHRRWKHKKPS